ncbi:MAG: AmmeMemoRadiSam system protein A [Gammaproteobacteria bacterium]|nr:AmmeMemoRadiSam system protein A [Gammaproteobacteria bacterium]
MSFTELTRGEQDYLLQVARQSIEHKLTKNVFSPNLPENYTRLKQKAASFVTLKSKTGLLRGCIGTLQALEALFSSVSHNAISAAFSDPRFPPLRANEWPLLNLSISVLSSSSVMDVSSEADLKEQLRAGIDGLILKDHGSSATFLPSVWDDLSNKDDFIHHLKLKAGLPANYWSETIEFSTYQSLNFSGPAIVK